MRSLIIGGEYFDTNKYKDIINPSNKKVVEKVSIADFEHVKRAIDLSYEAFENFSNFPLKDKYKILIKASEILEERKENIAKILTLESGKPIKDSRVEVLRAINLFRIAAEEARFILEGKIHRVDAYEYPPGNENRLVMEIREPIGVVGAILPFNFPVNSFAHKVAPNLMAGNTIVVKPSSSTPLSALELTKILYEAGLPKNVLSVLPGPSTIVGEEIIENKKISGITFTGSTETGLYIASKSSLKSKRIMMEMGGSDPFIIFDDADLSKVIPIAVKSRFEYAGQNCNAGKRFFIHEKIYNKFLNLFKENVLKLKIGDAVNENTDVGPVISEDSIKNLENFVNDALNKGCKLILGGKRLNLEGYFFEPTILTNLHKDSKVLNYEVFGPIAPIKEFSNENEAIELANYTEYGLQAAIFTKDLKKALKIAKELKAGSVMINDSTRLRWDALPFGGIKYSGLGGREGVRTTIYNMTEPKIVSINLD